MLADLHEVQRSRNVVIGLTILFLAACAGAVAAIHFLQLRNWALAGAIAVPAVAYFYLIRETNRRGTAAGTVSPAMVRYNRRMAVVSLVYVAAITSAVWVAKTQSPSGALLWLVAIVPALPIIAMIGVMMRLLIEEQDEYLRLRMATLALGATGFMLAVTTVWGFLETFRLVPHVPAYGAFIVWCAGLGAGTCWQAFRKSC
jgi:hypothetical protein